MTVLVVVLLMVVELELVGAVDNKAGHYSVSPGRQQAAAGRVGQMGREREREATHVAVPGGADPTNGTNSDRTAPTSEGTNAAAACVPVPVPSTVAGRGSGWADVHSGIHFLLLFSFFLGKATSALDRANGFSSHIFSCPKTSRGRLGREDKYLGREVMVTRETTCNLLVGENS